jgi:hypothetical protein
MVSPTLVRVENLGDTMNEIRTWLDAQKIQPVAFKTVGCPTWSIITTEPTSPERSLRRLTHGYDRDSCH